MFSVPAIFERELRVTVVRTFTGQNESAVFDW